MYSDVTQRQLGIARVEAYLDESNNRRLAEDYKAREPEKAPTSTTISLNGFLRLLFSMMSQKKQSA